MAGMILNLPGLGVSKLQPSTLVNNLNPTVIVRRKDTSIEKTTLLEEHTRQLITDFPDFLERFIKLPPSYEFEESRLHRIHGFPFDMNPITNAEREWRKLRLAFQARISFSTCCRELSTTEREV